MSEPTLINSQAADYKEEKINGVHSPLLNRNVDINVLTPAAMTSSLYPLLLLNDGQDMEGLRMKNTVEELVRRKQIPPIIIVGIVAADRMQEYGVASRKDYLERGSRAKAYSAYISNELFPFLRHRYPISTEPAQRVIAGCSMGGLSALDIAWNRPDLFEKVGAFSGSFWWRKRNSNSMFYSDHRDRLMHQEIRNGKKKENLKFWLQTGVLDEIGDRNKNGVIDSIDDTLDLIAELTKKGYRPHDIQYVEMKEGRHNLETWAEVMPVFLQWAFGN
ncbi:MAG: alpha/beta hydrolase-fold protein [Cyclobacteriaceae bacterium]|nr:alpha/beta hydrolase-fold protein [Cyclobacteriaceae bacterium]